MNADSPSESRSPPRSKIQVSREVRHGRSGIQAVSQHAAVAKLVRQAEGEEDFGRLALDDGGIFGHQLGASDFVLVWSKKMQQVCKWAVSEERNKLESLYDHDNSLLEERISADGPSKPSFSINITPLSSP
ncbi:hypothetical protein CCMA1212_004787 [Trichoderma ghanense]|uniref:Uncharacterized protein n=1 Tax=Trichoderma ghanense TaxID=65468 RepID=A0ABY2H6D4_9HYPO